MLFLSAIVLLTTRLFLDVVTYLDFAYVSASQGASSSVALKIAPALSEIRDALHDACLHDPERFYLVCPPMYRTTPLWYLDGMSEIMMKFSSVMKLNRPDNLLIMPSFTASVLEADGVHLTPISGLEFILFLFDSATELIERNKKPQPLIVKESCEAIRSLEDRVVVL